MGTRDKRIDVYIAKAQPFAWPILEHLRELVHRACPQVEEAMKWSFPVFEYKGMMCHMASFKKHCTFGFWKASLMKDKTLLKNAGKENSMGHLGRIEKPEDLPSDKVLIGYIKEAMMLNEAGVKVEKKKPTEKKPIIIPEYFKKALSKNLMAKQVFESFSPSNKREYLEWITEAKTESTRLKRLETAIIWMAEGKIRNWKYVKS
jgi:uncharacterized protein YdeI (YjbR/CyaY-like superfamily)